MDQFTSHNQKETIQFGARLAELLKPGDILCLTGDLGSGKTMLLAYLALTYARALRDGTDTVRERLKLAEQGHLPILLPLRDFEIGRAHV